MADRKPPLTRRERANRLAKLETRQNLLLQKLKNTDGRIRKADRFRYQGELLKIADEIERLTK